MEWPWAPPPPTPFRVCGIRIRIQKQIQKREMDSKPKQNFAIKFYHKISSNYFLDATQSNFGWIYASLLCSFLQKKKRWQKFHEIPNRIFRAILFKFKCLFGVSNDPLAHRMFIWGCYRNVLFHFIKFRFETFWMLGGLIAVSGKRQCAIDAQT